MKNDCLINNAIQIILNNQCTLTETYWWWFKIICKLARIIRTIVFIICAFNKQKGFLMVVDDFLF